MKSIVQVRDRGAKKRLANLKRPAHVTVGVHADDGAEPDGDSGITVAEVAAIHEFGLGVTERSWLRDFVAQNRAQLLQMLRDQAKRVVLGADAAREMDRFGLVVVGMVKERIIAGIDPPLAPQTLVQKLAITGAPKETPLVLFGQFISSIAHQVNK